MGSPTAFVSQRINHIVTLRLMRATDIPSILSITLVEGEPKWSAGALTDALGSGYLALVACHNDVDGEVVSYAIASYLFEQGDVQNVVVAPAWRGQGLGRKVMRSLIDAVTLEGVETLFLEVRCSNQVAINLYQSMGFQRIQKRRGYYPGVDGAREDALVFSLACH
ncbi:MAG TPA: ribosomal-protein-alanine N-acetyltransferase [Oceanospirillaceae bacterium]|jgi:ribosomal-protein-alanine N-acetyltransferase|nr:ribosomal-protein-alanine N-acetyltransferase [Oceanospirillaceae bacterium]